MTTPLQPVHVRINDAATGKPVSARVRITGPDGRYYPPHGRFAEFPTGRNQDVGGSVRLGLKSHAYVEGNFEVFLPPGTLHVEVSRGPEYFPIHQDLTLPAGKLAIRLELTRWSQVRDQGWYGGDTRVHFLTPDAALLEGEAEDLAVVNLLATDCAVRGPYGKDYPAIPNLLAFSGQQPAVQKPGHVVVVNTLNSHPVLGSLGLLDCHRVVYPLGFGGPQGSDDWSLAAWCDQCHRKGGLVVWARTWHDRGGIRYGEALADLLLGKVDAFEIDILEGSPFGVVHDWYRLLGCGLRVPLVGGSGKDSNEVVIGSMRTYARLSKEEAFSYRSWIEAIRQGRTIATNGPMISLSAQGALPGDTLVVDGSALQVRAEARSATPFGRLELLFNGEVIAEISGEGAPLTTAQLDSTVSVSESGWLAARCGSGDALLGRSPGGAGFAHTSPIYITRVGHPFRVSEIALQYLRQDLGRTLMWAQNEGRYSQPKFREQLITLLQSAQAILQRLGSGTEPIA